VKTSVRCQNCGAAYTTAAPPVVVEEVNRCADCGMAALVVVEARDETGKGSQRDELRLSGDASTR
jgi:rRNA maturation endonuclease Nob1